MAERMPVSLFFEWCEFFKLKREAEEKAHKQAEMKSRSRRRH